jgi:defect in organelle trafficking protein DotD
MKTKIFGCTILGLTAICCLAGCVNNTSRSGLGNRVNGVAIIGNDTAGKNAEERLADAATSIDTSLRQLAEVERAVHPAAKLPAPPLPEMIGMAQLASVEWSGPVGSLVEKIAAASKYKVRTLGHSPAIPILVSISAKNTPIADILRDASFQCGSKANVAVYPASKVIELRYAKG